MTITIRTTMGTRLDDEAAHLKRMSAGTADAECYCDTCGLYEAKLLGEIFILRPDGDGYWRLIYDVSTWH